MTNSDAVTIRRGDLRGKALATYIPRRGRGARHYADTFSVALWLAKLNVALPGKEGAGTVYVPLWGKQLAELVPEGIDAVAYPPPGQTRRARGWYLAEALARQVAAVREVPLLNCLTWAQEGQEASKAIVHHAGKGRALGKRATCGVRLDGLRVVFVDDLWTTGITALRCTEALAEAGAEVVGVYVLAATEATRDRPAWERSQVY